MRLEIHLIGGDESLASDLQRHHGEIYKKLTEVEMPVRDAVNLENLLHAQVSVRDPNDKILQQPNDKILQQLLTILEECRGIAKLPAIKHLRERMQCSLKTAKYLMDEVQWYNQIRLKQKEESIQRHKDFIQNMLEAVDLDDDVLPEEVIVDRLRAMKEKADES